VKSCWRAFAASLIAGLAAWLTFAPVVFTGQGAHRIALLTIQPLPIVLAMLVGSAIWVCARRGASLAPLLLLTFVLLPWVPIPLPPALLIWSGRAGWFLWAAIALGFTVQANLQLPTARAAAVAGAMAFVIYSLAAWEARPTRPAGDEPDYLIVTQSLLYDHDLRIENNHRRGDFRAYFKGPLPPAYLRRGTDGEIYSVHAPGVPTLVLPAFALGGYPAVVVFLIAIAALGSALAWHLAWTVTRNCNAAWFAWAAVSFNVTAVFLGFSLYPDGLAAVLVLTGMWALVRAEPAIQTAPPGATAWLLHGGAIAMLPWLHSRFVILAASLALLIALRLLPLGSSRRVVAFLAAPALSVVGWLSFFAIIYGTPNPAVQYNGNPGTHASYIADGLLGLLFDQRFGVVTHAPVIALAAAGALAMLSRPAMRRFGIELLIIAVPYIAAVTSYRMWWAGWSVPGRFFMPVLMVLAVPIGVAYDAIRRRGTRAMAFGALSATILLTTVLVTAERGELAYNVRTAPALLIGWLANNADLVQALPLWTPALVPLLRRVFIWVAVLTATWLAVRRADRSRLLTGRGRLAAAAASACALAFMIAASLVWLTEGRTGRDPAAAQIGLLRTIVDNPHVAPVSINTLRVVPVEQIPPTLHIEPALQRDDEIKGWAALATLPYVPAGDYAVRPIVRDAIGGIAVSVSDDNLVLARTSLFGAVHQMLIRLPVNVRSLVIRGDVEGWLGLAGVVVQPMEILCASCRVDPGVARRAVMYPEATVFFFDDAVEPGPASFSVGCDQTSHIVVQPNGATSDITLRVRNDAPSQRLSLHGAGFDRTLTFEAATEQVIDVPIDPRTGAVALQLTTGTCDGAAPGHLTLTVE
jgi:hypothetical protein